MQAALSTLEQVAKTSTGNLLEAAVATARARTTVGEISDTLRKVFSEHNARSEFVRCIYGKACQNEPEYQALQSCIRKFFIRLGIKPKIMIAKLGQDGHDRSAHVIASAFTDMGV